MEEASRTLSPGSRTRRLTVVAKLARCAGVLSDTPLYGEQAAHPGVDLIGWRPATSLHFRGLAIRPPSSSAPRPCERGSPMSSTCMRNPRPDNLWILRLFDCPIVLSFHGALHPEVFRKGRTVPKQLYVSVCARRTLYRRVARFVALCPAEAAHIEAVLPGRVIDTIPLGPGRAVDMSTAGGVVSSCRWTR